MSKERLEEINNFSSLPLKKRISLTKESIKKELKANDYHMPKNININTQYLLEIIEQAERVQELEEEINDWRDEVKKWQQFYKESEESHINRVEELKKQLEQVKKAADFLLFQIGLARSKSLIKAEFSGEEELYKALEEEI